MTVEAVRVWPGPNFSRITLELSGSPEYQVFTLKSPDRLVLDLDGVLLLLASDASRAITGSLMSVDDAQSL